MSDVHSNPVALETALADARAQGCEKFVLLGDITGYGYDAKKALSMARKNFDIVLLGNHDSACLGRETTFSDRMNHNYDIDRMQHGQLSKTALNWLGSRKFFKVEDGMIFAHDNFVCPGSWGYIIEELDALASFSARRESLMFCGHTHHLAVWRMGEDMSVGCISKERFEKLPEGAESLVFKRMKGERYIVNVGSIGYPRNDLCSSYAICDPEEDEFTIRRLPFDFSSYISNMLEQKIDLPVWLFQLLMIAGGK